VGQDLFDGHRQLLDLPRVAAEEVRLAVAHAPVGTGAVALVPVHVDGGLAGAAVVEEHPELAGLGPGHDVLPLAGMEAGLRDVVAQDVRAVDALDVPDLLIEDPVVLLVDLVHLDHQDVGRFGDEPAERVRDFDVRGRRRDGPEKDQGAQRDRGRESLAAHGLTSFRRRCEGAAHSLAPYSFTMLSRICAASAACLSSLSAAAWWYRISGTQEERTGSLSSAASWRARHSARIVAAGWG